MDNTRKEKSLYCAGRWEVRKSARGIEYSVWRKATVPSIHKQFLECVVYLYPSRKAADEGKRIGGTGFLIGYPSEVDGYHFYAVTNKHVIRDGKSPVIRLNTRDGKTDILEFAEDDWIDHKEGDDLAVCPIALPLAVYQNNALNWNLVQVPKRWIDPETDIGEDVFMVGRFINHEGRQKNTPAVQFGNISMITDEPIVLDDGQEQECILVEMRSQSGYSGSPVFLARPEKGVYEPNSRNPFPAPIPYSHIFLLGVNCAHIPDYHPVLIPSRKDDEEDEEHPEGWYVKSNTSMVGVVPSWRLAVLLEGDEDLKEKRKIEDERRLKEQQQKERRGRAVRDVLRPAEEEGLTPEGFEDALKRASRKISQPDEGTKET